MVLKARFVSIFLCSFFLISVCVIPGGFEDSDWEMLDPEVESVGHSIDFDGSGNDASSESGLSNFSVADSESSQGIQFASGDDGGWSEFEAAIHTQKVLETPVLLSQAEIKELKRSIGADGKPKMYQTTLSDTSPENPSSPRSVAPSRKPSIPEAAMPALLIYPKNELPKGPSIPDSSSQFVRNQPIAYMPPQPKVPTSPVRGRSISLGGRPFTDESRGDQLPASFSSALFSVPFGAMTHDLGGRALVPFKPITDQLTVAIPMSVTPGVHVMLMNSPCSHLPDVVLADAGPAYGDGDGRHYACDQAYEDDQNQSLLSYEPCSYGTFDRMPQLSVCDEGPRDAAVVSDVYMHVQAPFVSSEQLARPSYLASEKFPNRMALCDSCDVDISDHQDDRQAIGGNYANPLPWENGWKAEVVRDLDGHTLVIGERNNGFRITKNTVITNGKIVLKNRHPIIVEEGATLVFKDVVVEYTKPRRIQYNEGARFVLWDCMLFTRGGPLGCGDGVMFPTGDLHIYSHRSDGFAMNLARNHPLLAKMIAFFFHVFSPRICFSIGTRFEYGPETHFTMCENIDYRPIGRR